MHTKAYVVVLVVLVLAFLMGACGDVDLRGGCGLAEGMVFNPATDTCEKPGEQQTEGEESEVEVATEEPTPTPEVQVQEVEATAVPEDPPPPTPEGQVQVVSEERLQMPVPEDNRDAWEALLRVASDPDYQAEFDWYFYQWRTRNCTYLADLGGLSHWSCHQPLIDASEELLYEIELDDSEVGAALALAIKTPGFHDDGLVGVVYLGDKAVKIIVTTGVMVALKEVVGETFSYIPRHSNPSHDPKFSELARQEIYNLITKAEMYINDPKNKKRVGPLLCGFAMFEQGAIQFRVFDPENKWLYLFNDGGWVSAFETTKDILGFMSHNPSGSTSREMYNPDTSPDMYRKCMDILKVLPGPNEFD